MPATDLRKLVLTLAVLPGQLPRIGAGMRCLLPAEEYDPEFQGQQIVTTYFDTADFSLRRIRKTEQQYLVIRIRCYGSKVYALSVKTESGKYRVQMVADLAESLIGEGINGPADLTYLPGDFLARYLDLVDEEPLLPVIRVSMLRYAVESTTDRLTLDTGIETSAGKCYPSSVLEVKSVQRPYQAPFEVRQWGLSPLKISKFLWATSR